MTAPQDPFGPPAPGSTPPHGDGQPPSGQPPLEQPGDRQTGQPAYGQPAYGQPAYGQPAYGQPAYGQPAYGQPAFGQAGAPAPRNGLGVAALVLGILAVVTGFFVLGGLLGLVAVVLGFLGRGRAKRGEATNGGMALAGIILGVVGILLTAVVVAVSASFFSEFSNLSDCLSSAGSDQAAVDACGRQFQDQVTQ